jgi:hypothetical protein
MEIVLASQRVAFEEAVPFVVTGVAPGSPVEMCATPGWASHCV